MGRYSPQHSYSHAIDVLPYGGYRLLWTVDRYYKGSRQRFPTTYRRDTEYDGAVRFAKRWGLPVPPPETEE